MIIKPLYRYSQADLIVDSPTLPENISEYIERFRLIAESGKVLTKDDETLYFVIDIDKEDLSLWHEIEEPLE